ncbi:hypothetical protein PWT90_02358 [Aphanocladium album]|nr:hypothetical protein PWT90_02358 [Aphanocladium album]
MSYYNAPGGVPYHLGYPVYLFRPRRADPGGPEKLYIWIVTPDRFIRGCAGLLVTLTSNRRGLVNCNVTVESELMEAHGTTHVGFLYPERVTLENARSWWPEEIALIDIRDTLEGVFWKMAKGLEDEGSFVLPEYFERRS